MSDYVQQPEELKAEPNARAWFEALAGGNADVFRFAWACWNFEHVLDDLVDGDKAVTHEHAARAFAAFWTEVALNPWFRAHSALLHGALISAINRWVDGDQWAQSTDPAKRALAPAIRCGDVDFYLHVAYVAHGWEHLRAMRDFRHYDPAEKE